MYKLKFQFNHDKCNFLSTETVKREDFLLKKQKRTGQTPTPQLKVKLKTEIKF